MIQRRGLTIGQISDRTGLAPSAIRFYEEQGLVTPDRTDAGQRRYAGSDIRRLSFVMIAQNLGFSISEIRAQMASLPQERTPTKADWTRIANRFRRVLDQRIRQMQVLSDKLDGCIGCGCLSLQTCRLYNPEDRAARLGRGPRYLMGNSASEVE